MSAADLARLELAKRAYRAVEPSAAEVQRGVRRARLGLQRPRRRSTWLSKTLVAVVLAMGGLAYAKPQALGELVQAARHRGAAAPKQGGAGGGALPPTLPEPARNTAREPTATQPIPLPPASPESAREQPRAASASATNAPRSKPKASATAFSDAEAAGTGQAAQVSDWGRVGSALARGDETRAMAVLNELSESDDPRTRDKADLGRAQLMMSRGNREQACDTARSLTTRRAGSRIERQAQALLKGCTR